MLNMLTNFTTKKQGVIGLKKIISVLLAMAMVITFMLPAMASSTVSTDMGLENAIKIVKGKIDIPKELSKFSYNINNYGKLDLWRLTWSNEKGNKSINVTIDENNLITSYYADNDSVTYEKKIPKYSEEQGLKIAEKFVNNLDAKLLQQFKRVENTGMDSYDRDYSYNFDRQVNGFTYSENSIQVNVNKYTGEISSYNCSYDKDISFEDASKLINLEEAEKAFADKLGLKLVYNVKTENEKKVTYLAYIPKYENKYIDAVTGSVEAGSSSGRIIAYDTEKASMTMAAGSNIVLTPDELNAVKGMSDIITKEEIDKKIRAISLFNLDSGFNLTNAYLNKGWRNNDSFGWSLNYTKVLNKDTNESLEVSVTADAKTGEIQNFWLSSSYDKNAKPIKTKEEAKAICDDVLKTLLPNKYAKLKYDDAYDDYNNPVDIKSQSQFNFRYVRVENGIECPSEYVNMAFDNLSGKVSNLNSNWTKELEFTESKPAVTLEKAYEVLFEKIGYGIQYISDYTNDNASDKIAPEKTADKAVLGYFINKSKPSIISASTGDILNTSGDVYKSDAISDYTDIKGLKAEDQIKILTQMSIKYRESELKPAAEVLQKDYFILLSKLNDSFYLNSNLSDDKVIEQMYSSLISQGIITEKEKAPNSVMTREQAAGYFVKFLKLRQVAEIKGIYKSDFKDANKITPALTGYVCLASGLKALNGNNGYFNPKGKFTRLDALLSIYSYLNNK